MDKQTFGMMRERLLARAGLLQRATDIPTLAELERTEWSQKFERLMRNRMIMGAMRYGRLSEKRKKAAKWDIITPVKTKLKLYVKTGNTEYLVDMANYCLIIFECHPHPTKHFRALDDHHDHCKEVKRNLHPD